MKLRKGVMIVGSAFIALKAHEKIQNLIHPEEFDDELLEIEDTLRQLSIAYRSDGSDKESRLLALNYTLIGQMRKYLAHFNFADEIADAIFTAMAYRVIANNGELFELEFEEDEE